jgi:protein O-mannosyl-transferase
VVVLVGFETTMPDRNPAPTRHANHSGNPRFPLWYLALIIGAGAIAFSNSVHNPFIWDDQTAITDNPTIRALWPPPGPFVPPLETPVSRRPLVNISFALNYAFHGLDVRGYHVVNLVLHVLAACLLFGIVRRALSSERLDHWLRRRASPIAVIAALLWMVHPLVSEVVNYATQRTTVMADMFFFATLYAAQRALVSCRRGRWHTAAATACVLGMLSKESVAVAPIVVMLYDRIFAFPTVREALAVRARFYGALAVAWVPLGALLALRPHTTVGFSTDVTPWTYLLNQAQMVPRYLRLAIWPDALVLDYGFPRLLPLADAFPGALVVGALMAGTLVALWRWPAAGFLGAAFFLTIAPSSSIVPIATEVGAERRMYLPLAAIVVFATVAGSRLVEWVHMHGPAHFRRQASAIGLLVAVACTAGLMARTVYRNAEFSTVRSIWRTSVERWPQGRARASYASALIEDGEDALALEQLALATSDFPLARFALANELTAAHRYDDALRELSTFINEAPRASDRIPARALRGRILADQGHLDDAVDEFRALVALFPTRRTPRADLADLLYLHGDYQEAASHYRLLLDQEPTDAGRLARLGMALASAGRLPEAVAAFQTALQIDPAALPARVSLVEVLLRAGKTSEAAVYAEAAIAREPRNASAHNLLGVAMAKEGRLAEAMAHFETSVEADPGYAEARQNLALARRALRHKGALQGVDGTGGSGP